MRWVGEVVSSHATAIPQGGWPAALRDLDLDDFTAHEVTAQVVFSTWNLDGAVVTRNAEIVLVIGHTVEDGLRVHFATLTTD